MPLSWEPHLYGLGDFDRTMYENGRPDEGVTDEERDPNFMPMFYPGEDGFVGYFGDPDNPIAYKNNPGGATREENSDKMGTGKRSRIGYCVLKMLA